MVFYKGAISLNDFDNMSLARIHELNCYANELSESWRESAEKEANDAKRRR